MNLKCYRITQERLQEYVGAFIFNCPKACLPVQHTTQAHDYMVHLLLFILLFFFGKFTYSKTQFFNHEILLEHKVSKDFCFQVFCFQKLTKSKGRYLLDNNHQSNTSGIYSCWFGLSMHILWSTTKKMVQLMKADCRNRLSSRWRE